jgi:hypothetical protein
VDGITRVFEVRRAIASAESNREHKKPKADKKNPSTSASAFTAMTPKNAMPPNKKRSSP